MVAFYNQILLRELSLYSRSTSCHILSQPLFTLSSW
uniref:Uncharacterized protein n=1 Tax=Siphoviridae sp. ctyvQ1 TaxID=2826525 RepID=A0A8S5QZ98_9CAUD|nr:MAG TPA: hypothetical protein [Siphoviridae sp. ctyvQ1]